MTTLTSAHFWFVTSEIIVINLMLSADNAVVIALACRHLKGAHRTLAMTYGVLGAVCLLVGLTAFAGTLLTLPYLKLVGGALLAWIGIRLIVDENRIDDEEAASVATRIGSAVKVVVMADLAMSFDNVLGVAAVADGNVLLVAVGLAMSIPLVVFAGGLVIRLMDRFRWLPVAGAGLLGYVAGDLMARDPALMRWIDVQTAMHGLMPVTGAVLVVATGVRLLHRQHAITAGPVSWPRRPSRRGTETPLSRDRSAISREGGRDIRV